jgi:exodeoxyribonuclease VII small subunit
MALWVWLSTKNKKISEADMAKHKVAADLSFEEASSELETLVSALESEQKSLEEAMKLYERGQTLVKRCVELLEKAELKVKLLAGDGLTDFESES